MTWNFKDLPLQEPINLCHLFDLVALVGYFSNYCWNDKKYMLAYISETQSTGEISVHGWKYSFGINAKEVKEFFETQKKK